MDKDNVSFMFKLLVLVALLLIPGYICQRGQNEAILERAADGDPEFVDLAIRHALIESRDVAQITVMGFPLRQVQTILFMMGITFVAFVIVLVARMASTPYYEDTGPADNRVVPHVVQSVPAKQEVIVEQEWRLSRDERERAERRYVELKHMMAAEERRRRGRGRIVLKDK